MRSARDWARARIGSALVGAGLVVALLSGSTAAFGAADDNYRLSVGDVVTFDFTDDTEPAQELTIAGSGEINVPLLGSVDVVGMTVPEASTEISKLFVKRQIFINPQISLAVTKFRPIFVLGDVKAPGSFPFQPLLTVEQAVALAGGQATGSSMAEDRVVVRARLRGTVDTTTVEIAREAVAAARVTAQLAGREVVSVTDLPAGSRDIVGSDLLAMMLPTEQKILASDLQTFETRRAQLSSAITEVESALANLDELSQKQKATIASAQGDLDRIQTLQKRGIKTLADVSNAERDATAQEAHLLEIYNQMSTTRRELGELQRQLTDITGLQTRTALTELQTHNSELERLVRLRRSTEEQILLLSNLAAEEANKASTIVFNYQIKRKIGDLVTTQPAAPNDPIMAGDTVIVTVDQPDARADGPISRVALEHAQ